MTNAKLLDFTYKRQTADDKSWIFCRLRENKRDA